MGELALRTVGAGAFFSEISAEGALGFEVAGLGALMLLEHLWMIVVFEDISTIG